MQSNQTTYRVAVAALCCAGIAVGSYISIPAGPVPFTLQTLFVLLTGLLLTPAWAAGAVAAYLLLGSVGLPVFAAGSGGFGSLLGPTGGYLWGFLPAAASVSFIRQFSARFLPNRAVWSDVVACLDGTLIIYAAGIIQLSLVTGMTVGASISAGMLPFLIGDAIKLTAAVGATAVIRPLLARREV